MRKNKPMERRKWMCEELYQAGVIDGLGRLGLARHITLPTIIPTIVLL